MILKEWTIYCICYISKCKDKLKYIWLIKCWSSFFARQVSSCSSITTTPATQGRERPVKTQPTLPAAAAPPLWKPTWTSSTTPTWTHQRKIKSLDDERKGGGISTEVFYLNYKKLNLLSSSVHFMPLDYNKDINIFCIIHRNL